MSLIIIGAGISGLSAGNILIDQGFEQFRILEARPDVGGRIQNLESSFTDVPLPLGADVPFTDPAPFTKLPFSPNSIAFCTFDDGCASGGLGGLDADDLGFNYVEVYEADRVLLATPPTTLAQSRITFNPPIPGSYQAAAQNTGITTGFRVWFEFSTKFYADLVEIDDIDIMLRNAVLGRGSSKNILTFEDIESRFQGQSSQQVADFLLNALDRVYNGAASASLLKTRVQNWGEEEFINCVLQGIDESGTLATPIDGRIFFTGEYVNGDFGEDIAFDLARSSPPNPSDVVILDGSGPVPVPTPAPVTPTPAALPSPTDEDEDAEEDAGGVIGGLFGGLLAFLRLLFGF